jgi:hypothetical protein
VRALGEKAIVAAIVFQDEKSTQEKGSGNPKNCRKPRIQSVQINSYSKKPNKGE